MRIILAFLLLPACARGTTDTENLLISQIMGDTLNTSDVRLLEVGVIGVTTRIYPARPQITCREKIAPPPSGPTIRTRTAGAVAWTHVLTSPDWTAPDYVVLLHQADSAAEQAARRPHC